MHPSNPCNSRTWGPSTSMNMSMTWHDFDFNAPLSPTFAIDSASLLHVDATPPPGSPQLPQSSSSHLESFCGVCARSDCRLKTHRDFLSRTCRARAVPNEFGSAGSDRAEAPAIDDTQIRAAFTKSYAFVTPEIPIWASPSYFRLDGFHDFPIRGGDQPEIHGLIWNFLNGHLRDVLPPQLNNSAYLDAYKYAYLVAAMSDPVACFCILAVEAVSKGSLGESSTTISSHVYQKCIEYLRQGPNSLNNAPTSPVVAPGQFVG